MLVFFVFFREADAGRTLWATHKDVILSGAKDLDSSVAEFILSLNPSGWSAKDSLRMTHQ